MLLTNYIQKSGDNTGKHSMYGKQDLSGSFISAIWISENTSQRTVGTGLKEKEKICRLL